VLLTYDDLMMRYEMLPILLLLVVLILFKAKTNKECNNREMVYEVSLCHVTRHLTRLSTLVGY